MLNLMILRYSIWKFKLSRANMAPAGGSNLRAWRVAAAPKKEDDSDGSDDEELDWVNRHRSRNQQGGRGGPPVGKGLGGTMMPSTASLPSMAPRPSGGADDSDSGSDVEPIFMRR